MKRRALQLLGVRICIRFAFLQQEQLGRAEIRILVRQVIDLLQAAVLQRGLFKKGFCQRIGCHACKLNHQLEKSRLKISSVMFVMISSSKRDSAACSDSVAENGKLRLT